MKFAPIFALLLFAFSMTPVNARTITLRPGDQITIDEDDAVVVKCGKSKGKNSDDTNPNCHTFHSDSSCQGLAIGTVCEKDGGKKGECVSTGQFDNAPNCKCK